MEQGKPCVVFIDEMPCLDTPKSGFVHALGHFWNSWAAWQAEIKLIVCGSATSWMVRNIIDNHGGLHDRVTHEMACMPTPSIPRWFWTISFLTNPCVRTPRKRTEP